MNCPNCQIGRLNRDGNCPACGFRAASGTDGEVVFHADAIASGITANDTSRTSKRAVDESKSELPKWRVELSKRLQEIRIRRELGDAHLPGHEPTEPSEAAETAEPVPESREVVSEELRLTPPGPAAPRKQRRTPHAVARDLNGTLEHTVPGRMPPEAAPATHLRPEHQAHRSVPVAELPFPPAKPEDEDMRSKTVQRLYDNILADPPPDSEHPSLQTEIRACRSPHADPGEQLRDDKLILLSRTLAGLVDLIIVVFCSSSIVFAVDVLEGINVFDAVSAIHYSLLLLAVYLVYSLFFLGTARQTIGMMLTDLRIAGLPGQEPGTIRLIIRCVIFLIGLAAAGIGLLLGCFDRESRCLHDRLSHTHVERVIL